MAQQGNNQGNDSGDLMVIVMVIILLLLAGWYIWTHHHGSIVQASIVLRVVLLTPVALFNDTAATMVAHMEQVEAHAMSFDGWKFMMEDTGTMVRWIVIPIILALAFHVYRSAYTTRFSRRHSIQSLVKQEQAMWPEIAPVANLDLISEDPFKGKWAVSMSEREFARLHKIINEADGSLDREGARRIFNAQLGPRWRGVSRLSPHAKAMFAIFAMRIGGDAKGALESARRLARSYAKDPANMDFEWVDEAIATHESNALVQKAISRHAWVYTVLCTMLQLSRTDGVFASPLWIWLRPVDRRLFYALNCVGRYAHFVEVGGIMAQWRAEKKMGVPLGYPETTAAINGLEKALKDYCDDDYLEKIFK